VLHIYTAGLDDLMTIVIYFCHNLNRTFILTGYSEDLFKSVFDNVFFSNKMLKMVFSQSSSATVHVFMSSNCL